VVGDAEVGPALVGAEQVVIQGAALVILVGLPDLGDLSRGAVLQDRDDLVDVDLSRDVLRTVGG